MAQNSYLNSKLPYYPHLKKNLTKRSIYERYLNGAIEYIYHGTSETNMGSDDLDTFISKWKSSDHGKNSIHSTTGSKEKTSSKYEYMEGYTVTHHASNEHELSYMTNIFNYYSKPTDNMYYETPIQNLSNVVHNSSILKKKKYEDTNLSNYHKNLNHKNNATQEKVKGPLASSKSVHLT